jgi:AcrR family transcriptional regulator
MSRPQSITDDEILAAARAVFLEKGITATVDEVATRCHVGEATIFRRFPTKQALFLAAMDTTVEPPWLASLKARSGSEDLRAMLIDLATEMVAHGRKMIPLIVMKMSNPAMWQGGRVPSRMLPRVVQALTELFAIEIDAGRIKAKNPQVAARIWVSSVQQYVMFETLTRTVDPLPVDVFVEGLVDLLVVTESSRPPTRTSSPAGRR